MSIDAITSASSGMYAPAAVEASAATDNAKLDKQAFLELLIAQLSNQDPSSPMDTDSLMTQTTQMASMEALTELSSTQRESFALQMRASAVGLVGQQVTYAGAAGATVTGTATGVSFAGPVPTVTVDGADVSLDAVSSVQAAVASARTAAAAALPGAAPVPPPTASLPAPTSPTTPALPTTTSA